MMSRQAFAAGTLATLLVVLTLASPPAFAQDEVQPAQTLDAARALTTTQPNRADAWRRLARALTDTGRYEEALAAHERAIALSDEPDLPTEVAAAAIESLLGDDAAARTRRERVVAVGRAQADTLPAAAMIAVGDAYAELARGDPALYRDALAAYEAVIARVPAAPQPHVAIGELLLERYNNTEALEAFRAALTLDAEHLPAWLGIARSQRFDRSPAAEQTLRRILEREPTFVEARLLLARLLLDSESYIEAQREIDAALAVNARSPAALAAQAALHYLRDERQHFDARLEQIRAIAPGYTQVFETLAEIAAQNRRYAEALSFARSQVALDPQAWRGHALVGVNRLRLGAMTSGRRSLETAFRGDPFDVRTRNTLELLDRLRTFETIRSRRFRLVAPAGEAAVLAPRLLPIAEDAYRFFAQRYGERPRTPIRIEVYARHEDFSVRTVALVGVDILGVSFGPVIALDSPSAGAFGPFNWAAALWHEIAHSFHIAMTEGRVPRWFSEGLAVYEERRARSGWGMDVSPGFLKAFREGRLASASDLNSAFLRPSYPEQVPHAYYQASLLIELIERDHGFDAIVDMLQGYADGHTTAELLTDVLGLEPAAFDAAFEAFVNERFERSLAGLFPNAASQASTAYPELLAQARAALEAGSPETAQGLLEQAVTIFPDHGGPGSALRLLARAHEVAGDVAGAIAALERSIAIDADDLEGHRELARLYRDQREPAYAAGIIERALLIQPFDHGLHQQLAEVAEAQDDWSMATTAWAAVVALDPPDEAAARYRLARALRRGGQPQAAHREVLRTLEMAPLYEDALELLLTVRAQLVPERDESTDTSKRRSRP